MQMLTLQKRSNRNRLPLLKRGGCDAYFLVKIPEHGESISPSSFYGHLPDCYSHVLALDEFFSFVPDGAEQNEEAG